MTTETIETQSSQGAWAQPTPIVPMAPDTADDWQKCRNRLRQVAEAQALSRSEVARRSEIPMGTLSSWYDGKYAGNMAAITLRAQKWLDALEERKAVAVPPAPGYVETPTAREIADTLLFAQAAPSMVVITLGAGCGKTVAIRNYADTRPSVFLATMRPTTAGCHAMLRELARALGIVERNPALLDTAIGEKLRRNGRQTLLILDEAQHLKEEAVNQLRYFLDEYRCGIALVGNMDVHAKFGGATPREGYGQIHRRIGKRIYRLQPRDRDVEVILDAWGIEDDKVRRLGRAIARKPGALGQVAETLMLARILAAGEGAALAAHHVTTAFRNRGGEEIHG